MFALAADMVGDAAAIFARAVPMLPHIRALGFRLAGCARRRGTSICPGLPRELSYGACGPAIVTPSRTAEPAIAGNPVARSAERAIDVSRSAVDGRHPA